MLVCTSTRPQGVESELTGWSATSFKLLLIPVLYHVNHTLLVRYGVLSSDAPDLARPLLFLSGRQADGSYTKDKGDLLFVAHQIIWWSL
jgi:acyl-CoA-dependent ceramide synthase